MRRRYRLTMQTGEYFARAAPIPEEVLQETVLRVDARDRHPTLYHQRLIATAEHQAYTFEVWITPNQKKNPASLPVGQDLEYARCLGELRYAIAPTVLWWVGDTIERALFGKRTMQRAKTYHSCGPWESIPPDGPYGWRTRARWSIPKPAHPHPALHELVLTYFIRRALRPSEPLELVLTYEPRAPNRSRSQKQSINA